MAKVFTIILGLVMEKLISPNQSTILKGRMLVVEVVAINEVVDLDIKTKTVCIILNMDFEKAYDSVSWNFMELYVDQIQV